MNGIERETNSMDEMMKYFGDNLGNLPVMLQLQILTEIVKFVEALKPLYVTAMALRGDTREGEKDD